MGSGAEAAPPIFDLKNNTLVYLYLLPSLGAFYVQPGGLVPRARGRIYVAFGEHPAAGGLYMFFAPRGVPQCIITTAGCLVVSLWHRA